MKKRALFAAAAMSLAIVGSAQAATFQVGDVMASIGSGRVAWFDKNLNLVQVLNTGLGGFTTGSAFDKNGNFYVTGFGANQVSQFDSSGNLTDATFAACDAGSSCESIVFNAAGEFFVGHADGTRDIVQFSAAGAEIDRFNVATSARGSDWIDLSADGTTLIYTSENFEVFSYDTVTDTQNANITSTLPGRPAFALRELGDASILVADSASIVRIDSAGNVLQSYDQAGNDSWFALNVDSDGKSFWSGDFSTNTLTQFDILTGAILQSLDLDLVAGLSGVQLFGVSVFGERLVGGGGGGVVPIPGAIPLFLTGLAGYMATRRRKSAVA